METQELNYELFFTDTRDCFPLDAKSMSAARDEAKAIFTEYCEGLSPRKRLATLKKAQIITFVITKAGKYSHLSRREDRGVTSLS